MWGEGCEGGRRRYPCEEMGVKGLLESSCSSPFGGAGRVFRSIQSDGCFVMTQQSAMKRRTHQPASRVRPSSERSLRRACTCAGSAGCLNASSMPAFHLIPRIRETTSCSNMERVPDEWGGEKGAWYEGETRLCVQVAALVPVPERQQHRCLRAAWVCGHLAGSRAIEAAQSPLEDVLVRLDGQVVLKAEELVLA